MVDELVLVEVEVLLLVVEEDVLLEDELDVVELVVLLDVVEVANCVKRRFQVGVVPEVAVWI